VISERAPDRAQAALAVPELPAPRRAEDSHWMPEIDGLRAIACLVVVIDHFTPWGMFYRFLSRGALYQFWDATAKPIAVGSLGVMLFFSISSFLLTYLAVREWTGTGTFSPKHFLIRRTLRIWPLYYTIFLAYIAVAFLAKPHFPIPETMTDPVGWLTGAIVLYPLFIQNWFTPVMPEAGILWSLAVEEQFYLAFPWIMLLIFSGRLAPRWIVGGLVLVTLGFTSLFVLGLRTEVGLYYSTPTYFAIFAAGACAGWIVGTDDRAWQRWRGVLRRYRLPIGLCLIVGIGIVGFHGNQRFFVPYNVLTPPTFVAFAALFAGSILWILANRESLVSRVLRSRVMRDLGFLSFGIYMWHLIVKVMVFYRFQSVNLSLFPTDARFVLLFCYYVLGSIALATVTYWYVEQPFLRLKDRFTTTDAIRQSKPKRTARGGSRFWLWYFALPVAGVAIIEVILRTR
jgi:peptidoglycan/LPS O-acetylase OafA/YrhL